MSKRRNLGLGVGGSSLLMVFIIVSLTIFASLSLVSANADYRLSAKTAQRISEYYAADSKAIERLAAIETLMMQGEAEIIAAGLAERSEEGLVYHERINDRQVLQVVLDMEGSNYRVIAWQVQNDGAWAGEEQPLDIWQGQ